MWALPSSQVGDQVGDGPVVGVRGHPGTAVPPVALEQLRRGEGRARRCRSCPRRRRARPRPPRSPGAPELIGTGPTDRVASRGHDRFSILRVRPARSNRQPRPARTAPVGRPTGPWHHGGHKFLPATRAPRCLRQREEPAVADETRPDRTGTSAPRPRATTSCSSRGRTASSTSSRRRRPDLPRHRPHRRHPARGGRARRGRPAQSSVGHEGAPARAVAPPLRPSRPHPGLGGRRRRHRLRDRRREAPLHDRAAGRGHRRRLRLQPGGPDHQGDLRSAGVGLHRRPGRRSWPPPRPASAAPPTPPACPTSSTSTSTGMPRRSPRSTCHRQPSSSSPRTSRPPTADADR